MATLGDRWLNILKENKRLEEEAAYRKLRAAQEEETSLLMETIPTVVEKAIEDNKDSASLFTIECRDLDQKDGKFQCPDTCTDKSPRHLYKAGLTSLENTIFRESDLKGRALRVYRKCKEELGLVCFSARHDTTNGADEYHFRIKPAGIK